MMNGLNIDALRYTSNVTIASITINEIEYISAKAKYGDRHAELKMRLMSRVMYDNLKDLMTDLVLYKLYLSLYFDIINNLHLLLDIVNDNDLENAIDTLINELC